MVPREPIPATELKSQLTETVAVLALNGDGQRKWCENGRIWYPIDELIQSFHDMWRVSEDRLVDEGAIDQDAVAALDSLMDAALRLLREHSYPDPVITSWDTVRTAPEWENLRVLAKDALRHIGA